MASINYAAKEISVKVVYYGPGLSGKTTNLQVIHRKTPPSSRSDMVSLATETDRTLFFDFLPIDLGTIKGFATKFQLYTVPGQVYYNATRKLVLRGVDGVVFVADSSGNKMQENIESFQNLEDNLAEYGYNRENIPTVLQYNKRDLPDALPVEEIDRIFNKYHLPWNEAIASKGRGVFESLKIIGKLVIDNLNRKYNTSSVGSPIAGRSGGGMRPPQQPQGHPAATQPGGGQGQMAPPGMPEPPGAPAAQPRAQQPGQQSGSADPMSYGAVPFEPMAPQGGQTGGAPGQQRQNPSFDAELAQYQQAFGSQKPQQQPQQPQQQPQQPQQQPQQPQQQYQQPQQQYQQPQQQYQQPQQQYQQPQQQYQQPQQQPQQSQQQPQQPQQSQQQPQQPQQQPQQSEQQAGGDAFDDTMYFTSVNTERPRKKVKRPVNPKNSQNKGFLGKLFNRGS